MEMDETRKIEDKDVKSTRDVLKKWNDYYINNNFGIGIQCDKCKKWREVFQYEDQSEVPEVWICSMWKMDGHRRGSCRIPSDLNEDHFAEALYSPGFLVWAKCPGYPWWPAMIEDCPDVQHYFIPYVDSEHEYHVNFFGKKPLRNWIKASLIKDFSTPPPMTAKAKKSKDLQRSIEQANEALKISPKERLKKYSFAVRYEGRWAKVKELDKVNLPPQRLKRKRKEESTAFVPKLVAKEPHANRSCDRSSTVSKGRKGKSKSEVASKRKALDNEGFQPVQHSSEPKRSESSSDSEKEENGEEDSSEFRPRFKTEAPHVNQDCPYKSTVRKLINVKSKSKAATNRKSVKEEEFQPVLQSSELKRRESSSDSDKAKNFEEDSSEFRPQLKAKAPHVNQDCHLKSTVRKMNIVKSKSKAATNRKSVKEKEFQPVLQLVGAINESSSPSEKEKKSSEFRSQLIAKEPDSQQDCPSKLTVWEIRNAKSKTAPNQKSVYKEKFHPVGAVSESSSDSENSEEENSSESGPHVMPKKTHFNQDCPSTLTVWKARNAKSKPEHAIKRKLVNKEEFQTVQQPIKYKGSECPSDSEEENSEDEDSSEFRSQVMAKKPHFNQDCPSKLTVWKLRNVRSKPEDGTKRNSMGNEEFQQSSKHKGSECLENSDEEEDSEVEDLSETASPVMAKSTAFQDGLCISTVRKEEGKSEDTIKRKLANNEVQSVQPPIKHKRSECSTDSEKEESEEDSPILNNTTTYSDNEEEDSTVLNHDTVLSHNEEEESPKIKEYAEYLKKKYQPSLFLPDSKLLPVNGTGGNSSHTSSSSTIHYKHDDFSANCSIICHENGAEFLENDTVIHNGNAVENSQNDSGVNSLDLDSSLLRTRYPSCNSPKNEQFSYRSERLKKNRERIKRLLNSKNSKYIPYSFYRGRMKK